MFEYYQCEKIDDKAVYDVDNHINQVIAEDIKLSEVVIESKGEIDDGPGFQELLKGKMIF